MHEPPTLIFNDCMCVYHHCGGYKLPPFHEKTQGYYLIPGEHSFRFPVLSTISKDWLGQSFMSRRFFWKRCVSHLRCMWLSHQIGASEQKRMLSSRCREEMEQHTAEFYAKREAEEVPIRYSHR